ncbi:MAG: hypothetical protein AAF725_17480, partial [Acidobacteriota bacterium]
MALARLLIGEWVGVERRESVIETPSWHVVAHAVAALDGARGSCLTLVPDLALRDLHPHLRIDGGGGRYLVRGLTAEGRTRVAVDPSRWSSGTVGIVADGQLGDYPSHWGIDLAAVIAAAR